MVVLGHVADFSEGGTPECDGRAVDAFLDLVGATSAESPESLAAHVDDLPDGGTPELDVGLGFVEITVCSEVRAGSHACTMHSPSSAGSAAECFNSSSIPVTAPSTRVTMGACPPVQLHVRRSCWIQELVERNLYGLK